MPMYVTERKRKKLKGETGRENIWDLNISFFQNSEISSSSSPNQICSILTPSHVSCGLAESPQEVKNINNNVFEENKKLNKTNDNEILSDNMAQEAIEKCKFDPETFSTESVEIRQERVLLFFIFNHKFEIKM